MRGRSRRRRRGRGRGSSCAVASFLLFLLPLLLLFFPRGDCPAHLRQELERVCHGCERDGGSGGQRESAEARGGGDGGGASAFGLIAASGSSSSSSSSSSSFPSFSHLHGSSGGGSTRAESEPGLFSQQGLDLLFRKGREVSGRPRRALCGLRPGTQDERRLAQPTVRRCRAAGALPSGRREAVAAPIFAAAGLPPR